jgi:hypothetical protein
MLSIVFLRLVLAWINFGTHFVLLQNARKVIMCFINLTENEQNPNIYKNKYIKQNKVCLEKAPGTYCSPEFLPEHKAQTKLQIKTIQN